MQSILVNGLDAEVAEKEIAQMIRYSEDNFYHLKCLLEIMREQPGKFRSNEIAKQLRQVARRIVLETATPVQIQIADMLLRNADMVSVNDFQTVDPLEAQRYAVMKSWYVSQKYPDDLLEQVRHNDSEMLKENVVLTTQLLLRGGQINESNIEKVAQYLI